jgi:hypothetical protein
MKPPRWPTYALAVLVSSSVPALLIGAIYWRLDVLANTLLICLAIASIAGLPAYLVLDRFIKLNFAHAAIIGATLGAVPVAVMLWPVSSTPTLGFTSSNGILTSINGITTSEGWQHYWELVAVLAGLGAMAGTAFHAVAKRGRPNAA